MKKILVGIILAAVIFPGSALMGKAAEAIVPADVSVRVQYQIQTPGSSSWRSVTTSLRGAVTESMMVNQLSAGHPGSKVRILSASWGTPVSHLVRYQMKQGNAPWTTSTTTLNNALTQSMAKNQLRARYPRAQIRILSFVRR
ncbi:hypothetical protein [uncultured Victivallis sp.]|uniref:hypothetical protein n=1 Tax=uncultured Victivallis sp. TaxID=354118 RepID=UPI00260093D0|nr:hypothetical protein [uncultured Victivallis sp.]